ncbi:extracellular solute-binding protein [Paenibacillus sp. J5C_2022]|uniref:extracellular solute-binding protein n=1 Tax=Paenibacillus sp. J5C2022 TaxID=2977129 RepID=UPI0021D177E1|nr:extracellular solute-binding protein [Paenibacillus sp. J5C2022]MCU6709591.1 extracellular solute-binding protein [Paenibacillus sp. J5C2022]
MKKTKLNIPMLMVLISVLLLLSACSGNNVNQSDSNKETQSPGASANTGSDKPSASADTDPFAEKMTLNVYHAGSWAPGTAFPPKEDDVQRQLLEKAVNIDLQMTVPQQGEDMTKLNSLLAAGNIPDLIFFNDRTQAVKYYQDGVIAELDGYIEKFGALKSRFTEDQWNALTFQGKLIGTPGYEAVSGIVGWWIRKDWLETLGLDIPTTTEELFDVMKAFTFDDPDRNGKNDTYGMVVGVPKDGNISSPAGAGLGLNALMWLFGVNPHKVDISDGHIVNHNTDPRMKEAITYINRMVTEKVIDPDWVTISEGAKIVEKIQKGKQGIAFADWRMMDNPTQLYELSGEEVEWVSIPPVKGPDGKQILGESAFQGNLWAISARAAADPEKVKRILALLEYWYADEEAYPYFSYGDKDVFWKLEGDTVVRLMPEQATADAYRYNNHYKMPRRADDTKYYNFKSPEVTGAAHQTNISHSISPKPSVYLVPDESDSLYQDRIKYVNEMLLRFIYGREPIENWDVYIQTLEDTYKLESYEENIVQQFKEQGLMQ